MHEIVADRAARSMDVVSLVVDRGQSGERLDKAIAALMPEHSRGRLQQWIEAGHVRVNDDVCTKVRRVVAAGDHIAVHAQINEQALAFEAQDVMFEVVAEFEQWLVVNKQAGLVVHPGAGNWQGTLLNGLLHRYPDLAQVARAGIVHRLDKDTTGLMVVAKTPIAQTDLVRQLQVRSVKRQYLALAHGWLTVSDLTIDRSIGRDPRVPIRMSVKPSGRAKPAVTDVHLLANGTLEGQPVCQMQCQLRTGRTHQIRVHLSSVGHPLLGDSLYGGREVAGAARQMLHAGYLAFIDPGSGKEVAFECPMPPDMQTVWDNVMPSEVQRS
jgi:23S rRNA pseudouridine1911/1915/1917 synthase